MRINFDGETMVETSIARIRQFEPPEGYYLAFSGGKDSITLYDLTVKSGVKFDAHYSPTTIDPPELVRFIRKHYPTVQFEKVDVSMYQMIVKRGLPIRKGRWCCEAFKEKHGLGRVVMTGIRWDESIRRKNTRTMVESCYKTSRHFVNPIIDWSNAEVWEYIKEIANLNYCSLYDEGMTRIGCVLCPMETTRKKLYDLERWPHIAAKLRKATIALYERRRADGNESINRWESGDAMFDWWISGKSSKKDNTQQYFIFE